MNRILPWLNILAAGALAAVCLWSLYHHVSFEETMFLVLTAAWG